MLLRIVNVLVLCVLISEARITNERYARWQEFEEFVEWKRTKRDQQISGVKFSPRWFSINSNDDDPNPPPPAAAAAMARYVVNQAEWAAIATISTRKDIATFPTATLISISDGPLGSGTGIPYMYLTPLDFTAQDLAKDHRATLLMSLAQGSYCKSKDMDPMDPRCARIMLTGKVTPVKSGTDEHETAKQLFFNRHPKLSNMPADHKFFFAKLKISTIALLDAFGGPKYISVEDYFNVTS
ncbi:protein CREG1 [Pseudomyrmex gracilis]|uniref:protein CREG1 n=1 Tax=Pseudomyrmex gracilis TaxID=219809 RepID=UPI0009952D6D|nr:protein CREG1 [Pseudomyrmex gracilis]